MSVRNSADALVGPQLGNPGDFFEWWVRNVGLLAEGRNIFLRYYKNYAHGCSGWVKKLWMDRHLELEREVAELGERGKRDIRILDVGSGTGTICLYLAAKFASSVVGIDLNKRRHSCAVERKWILEKVLSRKIDCLFFKENLLTFPKSRNFDILYLQETLHHLEPRKDAIHKISSLVGAGGVVVVSEVNAMNPFIQAQLFAKRGLPIVQRKLDDRGNPYLYGKERILTHGQAITLFREAGFYTKSLRFFRVFGTRFGREAEKKGLDVIKLERLLEKLPVINRIFTVHYNLVLLKL